MKKQTPLSLSLSLLFACFWGFPHALAQDRDYTAGETLHVLASSGLRLRDAPAGKTVLATLPYGAKLIAGEKAPYPPAEKIDGLAGSWIKATYNGKSGYVFDGYLGVFPGPDTAVHSLKAYADRCFVKNRPPEQGVPINSFEIFGECANGTVSWGQWGNTMFIRIITGC